MKTYNKEKTHELNESELDFEKGHLEADKLFIRHHEAVEAQEAIYTDRVEILPNGSTQVWKDLVSPAVEAKEAYDEYGDIQVYVPYTQTELAQRKIYALKQQLLSTDYQAIKYAEGEISASEYYEIKQKRKAWRSEINTLETQLIISNIK